MGVAGCWLCSERGRFGLEIAEKPCDGRKGPSASRASWGCSPQCSSPFRSHSGFRLGTGVLVAALRGPQLPHHGVFSHHPPPWLLAGRAERGVGRGNQQYRFRSDGDFHLPGQRGLRRNHHDPAWRDALSHHPGQRMDSPDQVHHRRGEHNGHRPPRPRGLRLLQKNPSQKRSRTETEQHQPYGGINGAGSARPRLCLRRQRETAADPGARRRQTHLRRAGRPDAAGQAGGPGPCP